MHILLKFWNDRRGYTSGVSLILVVTILGIGTIVGLATVRNHITQEFTDVATGLHNLDQSFSAPCYGTFIDKQEHDEPDYADRRRDRRGR